MNAFQLKDTILYEDTHILVCNKPSGIPVQSAKMGMMDMESAARNYLAAERKQERNEIPFLAVIHRLDQPVEGILMFAKTPFSAKELNRQISNGEMEKYYWAVIKGVPDVMEGRMEDHLLKNGKTNKSEVVFEKTPGSKHAVLDYKVMKTQKDCSLVEILLITGRHHQIRVQFSHAGYPLVGDTKYNPEQVPWGCWQKIALCAQRLSFIHPKTKKKITFSVNPTGDNFLSFL